MAVPSVFTIPATVFWPYCAGGVYLAIGLAALRGGLASAPWMDKIVVLGRLFFAVPLAVFAAEHFASSRAIMTVVPSWMPAPLFWTYFVGAALFLAAASILLKIRDRFAVTLLGIMFVLFVLMIHLPRALTHPGDRFAWAVATRDLSFAGGAWALTKTSRLVAAARTLIGPAAVFFGVEHLLHPSFAPGVPLAKVTPVWIPVHLFWAYLAGAVLIAAGACILAGIKQRTAATVLGATIFLIVLVIYLPILIAIPSDVANGLNYFADTLAYSGAILAFAEAAP